MEVNGLIGRGLRASNFRDAEWIKRRWLDFRNGHSLYLIFAMAFIQFVVVTYTLALKNIQLLNIIFPSMWIWGVTFVAVYFPLAVVIGHFHRKLQIPTEQKLLMYANPYIYIAQPGREQLFHMPILTLGFKAQLQAMILQNAMADAIEKIAKERGSLIPPIPRYDKLIFQEYENAIHVSESLTKGENILDILNSLKLLKSQEQNNQS